MAFAHDVKLQQSIDDIYHTFSAYATLSNLFGDCDWFTDKTVLALKTKQLRELSASEIDAYINHWTACGTADDFKHFLPRIFELFSRGELETETDFLFLVFPYSSLLPPEKNVIDHALMNFWRYLLNVFPLDVHPDSLLCALAEIYGDLTDFLAIWDQFHNIEALLQLALLAQGATYISRWNQHPVQKQQLIDWLLSDNTLQKLEQGVLHYADHNASSELLEAYNVLLEWKANFNSE